MSGEVTGPNVAIGRQMTRELYRFAWTIPVFVGLLFGYDSYYNQGGSIRVQKDGIEGGKMLYDFQVDEPEWETTDAMNPDYSQRALNMVKRTKMVQGSILPGVLVCAEPVDKYELNRIQKNSKLYTNWVKKIASKLKDKYLTKIQDELFPDAIQTGGDQTYKNVDGGRIMAFAYPLQTGYDNNDLTGTGTYMYLGIDLNAYPEMKAVNVGKTDTAYTVSWEAIEEDICMELKRRGANVDLMLVDKAVYAYMKSQLFQTIEQSPDKMLAYPGDKFKIQNGPWVVWEPKLDDLYTETGVREIYLGDSSTLHFGWDGSGEGEGEDGGVAFIAKVPGQPTMHLIQGYREQAFVNERPSWWGRVHNAEIPA
jgi:hypothetical protein